MSTSDNKEFNNYIDDNNSDEDEINYNKLKGKTDSIFKSWKYFS